MDDPPNTHPQEQALTLAHEEYGRVKWETIANNMPKFGCVEKWPKDQVEKKWHDMQPEVDDSPCLPEYELDLGQRAWSVDSSAHDGEGEGEGAAPLSAISATPTLEDSRSRTASDASSHLQFQQPLQLQQQQIMFDSQQCVVWTPVTQQ